MKLAATAINTMPMARPTISTDVEPLAAPATASTLSSDIDTSATTIWMTAPRKLMRRSTGWPVRVARPCDPTRFSPLWVSSQYIFQHTQSSSSPPASKRPTIARSWVARTANTMRRSTAPTMPHSITLERSSSFTREAARPTMMALSPASTTSMTMTLMRGRRLGRKLSCSQSSISTPLAAGMALPLRELEAAASLDLTVFLALDHATVARQEATLLEHGPQLRLVVGERLGDTVAHGSRLPRETAARDCRHDVELTESVGRLQRLLQKHLQHGAGEILR